MRTNKRVGAVVMKDGKILLIHRFKNKNEYWVLPGGGVEDQESLEEALNREVKEETGLDLLGYQFLGFNEHEDHQHYFYKCKLAEGVPKIGGPEKENSDNNNRYVFEWIRIEELDKLDLYPISVKLYLQ